MGALPGKFILLCLCLAALLVCSCGKHRVGEFPQVQRDLLEQKEEPKATEQQVAAPKPAATSTPVEFFPTKP